MEPRIQYARTEDGLNIAFATFGTGPAVVHWFLPQGHIQQQWAVPEFRKWYERLAQKRMLVQYDNRGTGLSEREVTDFSPEALMRDLSAVVDHLGLEQFAIFTTGPMGPMAVSYAARYPERVSHLVLFHCYARGSDLAKSPQVQALARLIDDWDLYTDTLAHYSHGWEGGVAAQQFGATIREGITHKTFRTFQAQLFGLDVTDLLPHVAARTLVAHRRGFKMVSVNSAKDLAAGIPRARLAILDGESGGFAFGDSGGVLEMIEDFLDEGMATPRPTLPEGTASILLDRAESETLGHKVFISYSAEDKLTAEAVCKALESAGVGCWVAPRDVLPGMNWAEGLMSAIHESRLMILVFSSHANASQQVVQELERGVHLGLPIVPVRIEDVEPTGAFEYFIGSRHWLDALTLPFEQHLEQLVHTVKRLLQI